MFEEANRENFVSWIAQMINESLQNTSNSKDFQWKNRISASNFDLIKRLQQCLKLSEEILISGLCFMKRTVSKNIKLTDNSVYKLAVTCIFIAQKFYSDFHYEIEDFSISSGITIKDINKLEVLILDLLDYNLILSERDYYGVLLFGKV